MNTNKYILISMLIRRRKKKEKFKNLEKKNCRDHLQYFFILLTAWKIFMFFIYLD